MDDVGSQAVALLTVMGIELDDGLTESEMTTTQARFGFEFGADHRSLLSLSMPVGPGWVNWRHDSGDQIVERFHWPTDGIVHEARNNRFWPASWGGEPQDRDAAEAIARERVGSWPKLVPVYRNLFAPAAPCPPRAPIFSVSHTDIAYHGADLMDFLRRDFLPGYRSWASAGVRHPFDPWGLLACGAEAGEL